MQLSRIRLLPRVTTANVCRMRSSACDTLARLCVRHVLCWPAFPLVSALRSTGSAAVTSTADCSAGCSALFAGFVATMAKSDFPRPCIIGYGSSPSRCGPGASRRDHDPGRLSTRSAGLRGLRPATAADALSEGCLHVHRVKNGIPSVHPIRGDEMRALRKLRRDYPRDTHVFVSERGGPISPIGFHRLIQRIGEAAKMPFPIHPHMLRHAC